MRKCYGFLVLSIGLLALAGCASGTDEEQDEAAAPSEGIAAAAVSATLEPKSGSTVTGTATFSESGGNIVMTLKVENAPPGPHAVHLHVFGDCSADDGSSAGGHWNPTNVDHGKWGEEPYHRGDIGNLDVGEDGTGMLTHESGEWTLGGDPQTDILGKAVIVHAEIDDYDQPTGNAGGRIACGTIQYDISAAGGSGS
jgi:Cu-Zn family superoxide dismutase